MAGRALHRMKRDVFAEDPEVLPVVQGDRQALRRRQHQALGEPLLSDPFWLELIASLGVERVEWDALPTPLTGPLPPGLGHSLHTPWGWITSARPCPSAIAVEGAVSSWPTEACRRSCEGVAVLPEYPWRHRRVVQQGNTTWLDTAAHLVGFARSARPGFDRLVLHPRVG